jgi:CheY-like chemotaxis protein
VPVPEAPQAPPEADHQPRPPARHIVLVEDNPEHRQTLRVLLELDGHRVDEAADGPRGVERILTLRPDLAVVDIGLPGLDGYEVARRIRADPGGKALFLVALTGYGQPGDRERALASGFDAHFIKPLDPHALARLLAHRPASSPR